MTVIELVSLKKETTDPYDHGRRCGLAGKSYFECPYSPFAHKYDYQLWMKGHVDGIRDRKLQGVYTDGEWT